MAKTARTPWKRANLRKRAGKASKHLSPAQKIGGESARPGRRYPNLVDNMRMAANKITKARAERLPARYGRMKKA